jgi:tetratricopeptide (TPR) repeat protein
MRDQLRCSPRRRSRLFANLLLFGMVILCLVGCSARHDPEFALREAESRLQANDPAEAERILREALPDAPQDPRLRIGLAKAELALGNATGAEGSLRRALDLGGSKDEIASELALAILAQGAPERAIKTIGDLQQWPQERRLKLATIKAEAELALTNYDKRGLTKQFADVFRLRAAAKEHGASGDTPWVDRRLADLGAKHAIVAAGREHAACVPDPPIDSNHAVPSPEPIANTRRVLKVGPSHPLKRVSDAARVAQDNDIIEIEAGRYVGDVAFWKQNGLLLRGVNGRPHLDSQGRTARDEGIWVFRGNDIVVENVEFSGAKAKHRNGSGIRFFGRNLTIRDSYFHHNEDGVLTWEADDSDILIERSVFDRNGYGDGQSHNIYIGRIRSFTLRFSHSHDSVSGHEVKSRAKVNYILGNRLTDENDGNSSYLIDLPEGGRGYVIGNILEKGPRAENPNAISFASEARDIEEGGLWVINNNFYNRYLDATFVVNRSKLPVVIANNVLAGAPSLLLNGPGYDHGNFRRPELGLVDPASYDFRVKPDSPLIDAGDDPGSHGETSLWPQFEYVHPASGRPRQRVGVLDIGAYEFCGW